MASLCLNLLPAPQPSFHHPRKLLETSSSSSSLVDSTISRAIGGLKPIVVTGNPPTFVSAPDRRIVAVGDLHGDLDQARRALQMAGLLSSDGQDAWLGKETVLIQLGDILDRGEDEIAILSLLRSLDMQAKAEGGAVFQVNGNHETMNVEGDFRYVDSGAFDECLDFLDYLEDNRYEWEQAFVGWIATSEQRKKYQNLPQSYWGPWNLVKVVPWHVNCPGIQLFSRSMIGSFVMVDFFLITVENSLPSSSFGSVQQHCFLIWSLTTAEMPDRNVHISAVEYGIKRLNWEVSQWMRGLTEEDQNPQIPFIATRGYDSIVWNRLYSRDLSDLEDYQIKRASIFKALSSIQSILEETLEALGAKAMVVGHTPQPAGVNCKYNCSIWRIDVGMSRGVLNSRPEVLEIVDGKARVIRSGLDTASELQVVDYT
ncbi:hypothetical protein CDL15_Pgr010308 [Punica granatum]|uniref:Calcineurin-like phosphoesterase domain-containing protein n=1 Tax=Punica granatum TaxID=22663 RepID=A0A218W1F3_PUNGR|nr:hypothetical protein CDL15_Pgr010308 [Punica granatum]